MASLIIQQTEYFPYQMDCKRVTTQKEKGEISLQSTPSKYITTTIGLKDFDNILAIKLNFHQDEMFIQRHSRGKM